MLIFLRTTRFSKNLASLVKPANSVSSERYRQSVIGSSG